MNAPSGKHHWNWKGDNIQYAGLHIRLRKILPKPEFCPSCGKEPGIWGFDLANITGIYNKEPENWSYLCRLCHVRLDRFGFEGTLSMAIWHSISEQIFPLKEKVI